MDSKMNDSLVSNLLQIKKKSYGSFTKGRPILITAKRKGALTSLIVDGKDVTPKPLNQNLFTGGKERQISVFEVPQDRHGAVLEHRASRSTSFSAFRTQSTVRFRTDFDKLGVEIGSVAASASITSTFTDLIYTPDLSVETDDSEKHSVSSLSTEVCEDDIIKMETRKMPSHVSLTLSETETFFLIEIPSSTVEKDTEEG